MTQTVFPFHVWIFVCCAGTFRKPYSDLLFGLVFQSRKRVLTRGWKRETALYTCLNRSFLFDLRLKGCSVFIVL